VRFGESLHVAADLLTRQAAAIADKQELSRQIPQALNDAQPGDHPAQGAAAALRPRCRPAGAVRNQAVPWP